MPDPNVVREQDSMTVEYALTRREVLISVLRSLAQSPRFRGTILLYAAAIAAMTLLIRASILHSLTAEDALIATASGLGYLVFISVWVTIRAKTSKRTLTVSSDGISTEVGRLKGQIPWAKIKSVEDTSKFVLIARTNGNAFFIPNRALSSPDHRNEFLAKISSWAQQSS
jgi:hypothetical protein